MVTSFTVFLKGLSEYEKEGHPLLRGRLPPTTEEALKLAFVSQRTEAGALAFTRVKQALTSSPVLVLPDFAEPFEDVCDACRTPPAVGVVLRQAGRPVTYYSSKLSDAELNYSVSDIEMPAVIPSLREWRSCLEGAQAPFNLVTDHQSNVCLDSTTNVHTVHRRARWLSVSCGNNCKWYYRPGRDNGDDLICHTTLALIPTVP
jgi:hypothetical protein